MGHSFFPGMRSFPAVARAEAVDNYPNTVPVTREIANGNAVLCRQLIARAKACSQRGHFIGKSLVANFMKLYKHSKPHLFAALTSGKLESDG